MEKQLIDQVLRKIKNTEVEGKGNERVKEIVARLLKDLFYAIDDLNISSEELWIGLDWLNGAGRNHEWGLIYAGTGLEHYIDERMDWEDKQAG